MKPENLAKELKRIGSIATEKQFTQILQKLTLDGFRELVLRSATDTGFLRSNWSVTIDNPQHGPIANPYKPRPGGPFISAPSPPTLRVKTGDRVLLYNNTEYAMHLETGTPNMRAQPMVQPTYYMLLNEAIRVSNHLSRKKVK